jgi:hypothetical protein
MLVFTAENAEKNQFVCREIPTNKLHSGPTGEILTEAQALRKNRHLPILPKKNILLSDLRVSKESSPPRTSGR